MPHFTSLDPFSDYFENGIQNPVTSNGKPDPLRKVTDSEAVHYNHIFCQPMLQNCAHFSRNKESHIHLLLHELGCHVHQIDSSNKAFLQL